MLTLSVAVIGLWMCSTAEWKTAGERQHIRHPSIDCKCSYFQSKPRGMASTLLEANQLHFNQVCKLTVILFLSKCFGLHEESPFIEDGDGEQLPLMRGNTAGRSKKLSLKELRWWLISIAYRKKRDEMTHYNNAQVQSKHFMVKQSKFLHKGNMQQN